jgi:hypothetical protein
MSADCPKPDGEQQDQKLTDQTVTVAPQSPAPEPPKGMPTGANGETGTLLPEGESTRQQYAGTPPAPPGYEVLAEVGRGGMGVVYRATQLTLNRVVALKVVLAGGHASVAQRMRFLAEAEAVAALSHPGIVGVYEFGTWDGQPYMALEFCPGGTLADKLNGTPLPHQEATVLVERMARAVSTAHARSIVHRDIKPANILLAADGSPKVGDFGLAKIAESREGLTATGAIMGTPSYMAPEQAKGDAKKVGPQADVYALGAVLYECLTGRPPFKGANSADTIMQALNQEPVAVRALNPLVPVDLETICLKCLEKEPSRRYASAAELADDLTRFLGGLPVVARPVGVLGRARRWIGRNQVVTGLLVAIVVAVAAGTTATYIKYLDEAVQREKAEDETRAKEQALSQLRNTLAALEQVTEEQKQTLDRLRVEKAATEDALLRGLLRPLRAQTSQQLTLEETRALAELAALPEERLRFRFIEQGLLSEGVDKIATWPDEVVCAAVELDRLAAVRLREVVNRVMQAPSTPKASKVACAFVAGALPLEREFYLTAARILVERIAEEKDTIIQNELSGALSVITPQLSAADVAPLAKILVERTVNEPDSAVLYNLNAIQSPLFGKLDPTDAAQLAQLLIRRVENEKNSDALNAITAALSPLLSHVEQATATALGRPLARTLVERLNTEKNANIVYALVNTLNTITRTFPTDETAALFGPPARSLTRRLAGEKEWNQASSTNYSSLMVLAPALKADDATFIANTLAARLANEKDASLVSTFTSAIPTIAERLQPPETLSLAKTLAKYLTSETDLNIANYLSGTLSLVAARLTGSERDAVIGPLARSFATRLASEKDPVTLSGLGIVVQNLSSQLSRDDATATTRILMQRLVAEKESYPLTHLNSTMVSLAPRLTTLDAASFVVSLNVRLVLEKDAFNIAYLAGGFSDLAARLDAPSAAAITRPVVQKIVERMATEKDVQAMSNLSLAIGYMSARIAPGDATTLGETLATRLTKEPDTPYTPYLVAALTSLTSRMAESDAARILRGPAQAFCTRLATEKDANTMNIVANPIPFLATRIASADAGPLAMSLARRLAVEKDLTSYNSLSGPITALAQRLSPADAQSVVQILTSRLTTEKELNTLTSLQATVSSLCPRLAPDSAAILAETVIGRMTTEKDTNILYRLSDVFTAVVPRLSDAALFAILKRNSFYSSVRTSILTEFGSRSKRTQTTAAMAIATPAAIQTIPSPPFLNVWELVDWVEKSRPDLDLQPNPRR